MKSRDVLRALQADGWLHVARKNDHWQFKHPERLDRVTAPYPKRDIPIGTLRSIEKQSGLALRSLGMRSNKAMQQAAHSLTLS
jgi:predicted RNA binding protein YcfA (HicA-like mRNA interferase family)